MVRLTQNNEIVESPKASWQPLQSANIGHLNDGCRNAHAGGVLQTQRQNRVGASGLRVRWKTGATSVRLVVRRDSDTIGHVKLPHSGKPQKSPALLALSTVWRTQTNLLALNAAIEAARAVTQGAFFQWWLTNSHLAQKNRSATTNSCALLTS